MRVNDGHTSAFFNIINCHIGYQSAFTSSGFSDCPDVTAPVDILNSEDGFSVFENSTAEKVYMGFIFVGCGYGVGKVFWGLGKNFCSPSNPGCFDFIARKMPKSGKFKYIKDITAGNLPLEDIFNYVFLSEDPRFSSSKMIA